jgi:CheY-like chemotaxis protein
VRRCLRDGIEQLRPARSVPPEGVEWVGYRILLLHYVRSLTPGEVCEELCISEATFYRRQRDALQALASLLWNAHGISAADEKDRDRSTEAVSISRAEMRDQAIALASRPSSAPIDFVELLEGVRQTIEPLAKQCHVRIDVTIPPDLPPTAGDVTILRQAILALLTECLKAAHGNTLEIDARAAEGRALWRIRIWGATQDTAFALQQSQGLRLGQDLFRLCDGEVWVDASTAARLSVCFSVPISEPKTMLVIEDDPATAKLYSRYVKATEYTVIHAQTAQDVESYMAQSLPDLIILDVLMPHTDGWLILETLKSNPLTMYIPVVICSVIEQPELALALGAAETLNKPISPEKLLQTIRALTSAMDHGKEGYRGGLLVD